jgi:hypothetical protein
MYIITSVCLFEFVFNPTHVDSLSLVVFCSFISCVQIVNQLTISINEAQIAASTATQALKTATNSVRDGSVFVAVDDLNDYNNVRNFDFFPYNGKTIAQNIAKNDQKSAWPNIKSFLRHYTGTQHRPVDPHVNLVSSVCAACGCGDCATPILADSACLGVVVHVNVCLDSGWHFRFDACGHGRFLH